MERIGELVNGDRVVWYLAVKDTFEIVNRLADVVVSGTAFRASMAQFGLQQVLRCRVDQRVLNHPDVGRTDGMREPACRHAKRRVLQREFAQLIADRERYLRV